MKILLLISGSFLYLVSAYGQSAWSKTDSLRAMQLYRQAKQIFTAFEKKHAGFIQTKNVKIHYLVWGKPSDVPLIYLHGTGGTAYELLPMADSLTKLGYYVVAIDYYGHGLTPVPTHEVSIYHVADDVLDLMKALNIEKAVIAGFSRGGIITSAFYHSYPERVLGLILIDGGSSAALRDWHKSSIDSLVYKINSLGSEQDTTYATEFDAFYFDKRQNVNKNRFELFARIKQMKNGRWAYNPGQMEWLHESSPQQLLDNVLRPTRVPLFQSSALLLEPKTVYRNLQVPMLIIDPVIENDRFPIEQWNRELKQMHPAVIQHHIYPNTNHGAHFQRQSIFFRDVGEFLSKVKQFHKLK